LPKQARSNPATGQPEENCSTQIARDLGIVPRLRRNLGPKRAKTINNDRRAASHGVLLSDEAQMESQAQ